MKIIFLRKNRIKALAALSLITISCSYAMEKRENPGEERAAKRVKVEEQPVLHEEYSIVSSDGITLKVPARFINNALTLKNLAETLPEDTDIPIELSGKVLENLISFNDLCLEMSPNPREFFYCLGTFLNNLDEKSYSEVLNGITFLQLTKKFSYTLDDFLLQLLIALLSSDEQKNARIFETINALEIMEINADKLVPENLSLETIRLVYALSTVLSHADNFWEILKGIRDVIAMLKQADFDKLIVALESIDFSKAIIVDLSKFVEATRNFLQLFKNKKLIARILDTLTAMDIFDMPTINHRQLVSFPPLNNISMTLLHMASKLGSTLLTKKLLEKGITANAQDSAGQSPLQYGIWDNRPELSLPVAEILLEAGADINKLDVTGATLLAWAVANGELEVVRFLLDHGADKNLARSNDYIPLLLARKEGYPEIAELLEKHTAPAQ